MLVTLTGGAGAGKTTLALALANYLGGRRDAHLRHTEPERHRCDLVVDGGAEPEALARQVWASIAAC